jgi:hypothetical protein
VGVERANALREVRGEALRKKWTHQARLCLAPLSPSGDHKPLGLLSYSALSFGGFFGRCRSLQNDEKTVLSLPSE